MIGDLVAKLTEARQKIDAAKTKLNEIILETKSENGHVTVKANANKMIIQISIDPSYKETVSSQELEKTLLKTINASLEEAARQGEIEMKKITKDVLPNFPGLV
jgi:DNA-binding protein YbaB